MCEEKCIAPGEEDDTSQAMDYDIKKVIKIQALFQSFSLRKVSKMIEVCDKFEPVLENEDMWFCLRHSDVINICPLNVAMEFSLESSVKYYLKKSHTIPMGCHKTDLLGEGVFTQIIRYLK